MLINNYTGIILPLILYWYVILSWAADNDMIKIVIFIMDECEREIGVDLICLHRIDK